MILKIIIFLIIIYLIITSCSKKESFNEEEDLNNYNYCLQNFTKRNCVPDKMCKKYGFKNLC